MNEFITNNEIIIRLGFFLSIFVVMALWEFVCPRRKLIVPKITHWINNLGIVFLNTLLIRLLFPTASVGIALFVKSQGWGIFNFLSFPLWVIIIFSIVILDLIIYSQHVIFHYIPVLWKIHRMHHTDLDIDLTTGARFHPIEIIISLLIKFSAIIIFGIPVIAVIIFEVILNTTAMFNHSNVKMWYKLDKFLRLFIVTPDMHRVHHSIIKKELNSNFGFNLPWWDKLFGTYKDQPEKGHIEMKIGLDKFRNIKKCSYINWMLINPFLKKINK